MASDGAWQPASPHQRDKVEILTSRLGNKALVRSLPDGSAEVVGVASRVGYRYRVGPLGEESLLTSDESFATSSRLMDTLTGLGVVMFAGSIAYCVIAQDDSSIPGWLVPVVIVGFVLAFFGAATHLQPSQFTREDERWQAVGKGWD